MIVRRKFCPRCKSKETIGNGGGRRLCRACGRTFFSRARPFPRHRFSERTILEAISFFQEGKGATEIRASLKKRHGIIVSRATIYSWIRKHSGIFGEK